MREEIKIHNEVVFDYYGERQEGKVIRFLDYMTEEGKIAVIICTDGKEREAYTKNLTVINRNDG
jgi:hypothetical protein